MAQLRVFWAPVFFVSLIHATAFAQVDEAIRKIIEINESAQTHEEYENNKPVIAPLKSRLFSARATVSPLAVCNSLHKVTDEQLLIFYEDISRIDSNLPLDCRIDLMQKIEGFLSAKNTALEMSRPQLTPCRSTEARKAAETLGPSVEVVLDNARAKTVTDGGLPACHVNFSFDDGPHGTLTQKLMAILAAEKVRVNFFVLGQNVRHNPQTVAAAAVAGHVIGNHTMTHANLPKLEVKTAQQEIAGGFKSIFDVFAEYVPFFRFPYGASTSGLKNYAYQNRWLDFFWNMDSLDWKIKDPEALYRKVLQELEREKKGLLLFHDVHPQTIVVVPYVLSALNEAGYTSVIFTSTEVLKSAPNQTSF